MRQTKLIFLLALFSCALAGSMIYAPAADAPRPGKNGATPATADDAGGIAHAFPRDSGDTDPAFWGHLTEDQEADSAGKLKAFAQKSFETLKHPLRLQESRFFLVYSDLPQAEAARDSALLERMYGKLCELFGLEKGQNIWRGKALVLIFSRVEDYRLYERLIENADPGGSYAMAHCFGNGMVHIAFDRYPDPAAFDQLLMHESVHGFLHRYRSPRRVPSWANEGLADEAAAELIGDARRARQVATLARTGVEKHNNSVGDLFTARHIDGWQYPVAETLTAWMIHQNRQGYLAFVNGIKDGQPWDESLKRNFKMPPEKLLAEYGKSIGVKGLQ